MTLVIVSDPTKPLTPIERAFAGALVGRIEHDGECYVRVHVAVAMCGIRSNKTGYNDNWRKIRAPGPNSKGLDKVTYYALSDVKRTAERLKRKRENCW